ncbi:hypothetical protein NKH18_24190 [Streptomyces sp. M10(2022)]
MNAVQWATGEPVRRFGAVVSCPDSREVVADSPQTATRWPVGRS